MASIALPLILLSAVMHASWNLIAKRAKTNGVALVWLFALFETVFFLPIVLIMTNPQNHYPLLYRHAGFLHKHPLRSSIPIVPGFSKAVKLAASLNFVVKLEPGQP